MNCKVEESEGLREITETEGKTFGQVGLPFSFLRTAWLLKIAAFGLFD